MLRLRGSSFFALAAVFVLSLRATAADAGLFGHRHRSTPAPVAAARVPAATSSSVVLRAINTERVNGRVPGLAIDPRVSAVAQAYANDMARRGFFGHVSPEGVDPFTRMHRVGLVFHAAGENIGEGRDLATAERAIYNDPPHRAIVLGGRFRHVGLGSARAHGAVILVEDFTD